MPMRFPIDPDDTLKDMSHTRLHLRRVAIGVGIVTAFLLVTASIDPDWTRGDDRSPTEPQQSWILGTLETRQHRVVIRATESGPRYDVYAADGSGPIAVDLTAEDVTASFPDLPIEGLDFSAESAETPVMIMIAPTARYE